MDILRTYLEKGSVVGYENPQSALQQVDSFLYFGALVALFLRWTVSQFSYSGQGKAPLYGDYEAQRHWMEITVNLEPKEWYKNGSDNDLLYWGLDYPPLTAYHSLINGKIAKSINSSWVELRTSRGTESPSLKLFMRSTVVVVDVFIYFSAVVFYWGSLKEPIKPRDRAIAATFMLIYPGFILIDHGHFQYNCVSLGFTLWAICFLYLDHHILASVAFSLSLNYKQMSLYHAFPIFFYLLAVITRQPSLARKVKLFMVIGVSVLLTFAVCWLPFLTRLETALQVVERLFPFNRGLYEDKVANVWCSLEVLIKLKHLFSVQTLVKISALATLMAVIPSGIHLLLKPSFYNFKCSLVLSSLGFFLFSFQVHEKSILLVALPVALFMNDHPLNTLWFFVVSTFSLQPLLLKDGLLIPYISLTGLMLVSFFSIYADLNLWEAETFQSKAKILAFLGSMFACLFLSISSLILETPSRYPDLHQVLNSVVSCFHFLCFLVYFYRLQFSSGAQLDRIMGDGLNTLFTRVKKHL